MATLFQKLQKTLHDYQYNFKNAANLTHDIGIRHKPSNMDKKYLIWGGKYKTVEEIPEYISVDTLQKVKTRVRIRVCNIMVVCGLIGCLTMVYTGRRALERGESVAKMNVDWHAEINKEKK